MSIRPGLASVLLAPVVTVTLALGLLAAGGTANGAGPAPVDLGTAASFAVLAGTPAVTNTGPTTIQGDLGISPAAAVTGFPPGTVSGTIHAADAVALQAQSDLGIAYTDAAGRTSATALAGGTLGGKTLVPGVYTGGALALTGTLTLDGQQDPNAVWIFQAGSSLVTASSSVVRFINGAQPCNVFWQVTSSATLGSGSAFAGSILALTSVTLGSGVTLDGRALARNGDVTLIDDTIMPAICSAASATASPSASPSASPTASASAGATPRASATPSASPSPSATPSATPRASASPMPSATPRASSRPTARPTTSSTAGPTLPPTDSLAPSQGPGPGPTPGAFVGVFLLAVVALALIGRRSWRVIRER
jgi:type VI secretion system secreted protein VgrG